MAENIERPDWLPEGTEIKDISDAPDDIIKCMIADLLVTNALANMAVSGDWFSDSEYDPETLAAEMEMRREIAVELTGILVERAIEAAGSKGWQSTTKIGIATVSEKEEGDEQFSGH